MVAALIQRLQAIVGEAHVLTAADLRAPYEVDWTRRFQGTALCVVRPADTAEVAAVLVACAAASVAVVPQGGNTGLVGGAVPRSGEVVLSLRRLHLIEDLDVSAGEVTAGAGVTLAALQDALAGTEWDFGVDVASRGSATVGGMIATNAGGIHVVRHGAMRRQLLGFEAVLATGEVIRRLPGLLKDNSGYDLGQLFAGSEGTLAVITCARLRLVPRPASRTVALMGLPDLAAALAILARLRAAGSEVEAAEVFFAEGLDMVIHHAGLNAPFARSSPCYLLVDTAGQADGTEALAESLAAAGVMDVAMAADRPTRERLWAYRERHTEAIAAEGIAHKLDVTLPLARLVEFEQRVRPVVAAAAPNARPVLFGHAGDGNLHVNLLGLAPDDDAADAAVLGLVASMGGSISAEHGIGMAKAPWLHLTRSPADIAAMRAIKSALDPRGLLNPGVIFPAG